MISFENGNDFMIITEDTFKGMTSEQREWVMFNTIRFLATDIKKLKRQRLSDKVYLTLGSALGAAAMVGTALWTKIKFF